MVQQQTTPIKNWIETMGFELVTSDFFKDSLINYYSLGNFGVYEEILSSQAKSGSTDPKETKFISWNPWGEDFEVFSVADLSEAYEKTLFVNPDLYS